MPLATSALLHVVLHAQLLTPPPRLALPRPAPTAVRAVVHQNRTPAGRVARNVLTLGIDIVESAWRPEGPTEPEVPTLAFAESGQTPSVPGPLIRVRAGTALVLTLRNRADTALVVWGLRPGAGLAADSIQLATGAVREVRTTLNAVGTFYYWAAFPGLASSDRFWRDSQLNGVIVVDAPGAPTNDRILLLSEWFFQPDGVRQFESALLINGKGWPHTETMQFTQGDSVRMRVINVSAIPHPMHLHGFFYRIESRGNGMRDTPVPLARQILTNTDLLAPGESYTLAFETSTPGNWLFHCHFAFHIDESASLHGIHTDSTAHTASAVPMPRRSEHMRGLVVGLKVAPRAGYAAPSTAGARRLNLYAQERAGRLAAGGTQQSFVLQNGPNPPAPDSVVMPSSVIELERGKPVRIMVHNRLREPTAVHWHGLEIESFPDGVPHWSGLGSQVFTEVAAQDSFAAEFTPPRSGTYPYHSHLNDRRQMTSGMYGALLVTDGPRDLTRDHLVVIGGAGPWVEDKFESPYGAVNGRRSPPPIRLAAGVTHRLRFVMLHPDWAVNIALQNDSTVGQWTPIAKDGADLPAALRVPVRARVMMGPGETADFEFTAPGPGEWTLHVMTDGPGWHVVQRIVVGPAPGA